MRSPLDVPSEDKLAALAAQLLASDPLTTPGTRGPFSAACGIPQPADEKLGQTTGTVPGSYCRSIGYDDRITRTSEAEKFLGELARLVYDDIEFAEPDLQLAKPLVDSELRRLERRIAGPTIVLGSPGSAARILRSPPQRTFAMSDSHVIAIVGSPSANYIIDLRCELRGSRPPRDIVFTGTAYRRGRARPRGARVAFSDANLEGPLA